LAFSLSSSSKRQRSSASELRDESGILLGGDASILIYYLRSNKQKQTQKQNAIIHQENKAKSKKNNFNVDITGDVQQT
jgi:hypothetical protein